MYRSTSSYHQGMMSVLWCPGARLHANSCHVNTSSSDSSITIRLIPCIQISIIPLFTINKNQLIRNKESESDLQNINPRHTFRRYTHTSSVLFWGIFPLQFKFVNTYVRNMCHMEMEQYRKKIKDRSYYEDN